MPLWNHLRKDKDATQAEERKKNSKCGVNTKDKGERKGNPGAWAGIPLQPVKRITLEQGNTQNKGMEKRNCPVLANPQFGGGSGGVWSEVELRSKGKDSFLKLLLVSLTTHICFKRQYINFPQSESVLSVTLTGKQPLSVYLDLWTFSSYFMPLCCWVEGSEQPTGWEFGPFIKEAPKEKRKKLLKPVNSS